MTNSQSAMQNTNLPDESLLSWRFKLARRMFQIITVISLPAFLASAYYAFDEGTYAYIPIYIALLIFMVVVGFWKRVSDKVRILGLMALIYFIIVLDFYTEGRGSLARSFLVVFSFLGAIFYGRRGAITAAVFGLSTMAFFAYLFTAKILPDYQVSSLIISGWISNTVILVVLMSLVIFSIDYLISEMMAFLTRTRQLNQLIEDERAVLEQRVIDRTKALAASIEVSRSLSTILDQNQLIIQVVEQVRQAFDYYHVHIYLYDENGQELIMAGGTGEAGKTLLAHQHKISKGKGLVGRAATSNTSILVPDVSKEEGWLPNALLPDTKSEAAIPISSGKQVLGVLDVQQNIVNGLNEEDVLLLQSLASQVSISLQNARSFEKFKEQAELESLVNAIGQKIQRTATVEDTLQIAIREIGLALGASRVTANIQSNRENVKASNN
jgi:putative methionine-R-sulfoxide reductase with GAF domain